MTEAIQRQIVAMKDKITIRMDQLDAAQIVEDIQTACRHPEFSGRLHAARSLALELTKSFHGEPARVLAEGWES